MRNRNKGIPNLMLYITLATALVYVVTQMSGNYALYSILFFDRKLILQGQVWRLLTYPLTYGAGNGNIILIAISLYCYYSIGRSVEYTWGTLKLNLFYLTGVVLMDVYCLVFGGYADVTYLNLSLILAYATLYPNAQFLIFFIIPMKAWILGLFYVLLSLYGLFAYSFPANLFSVIAFANYYLFFGSGVVNLLPLTWRIKANRFFRSKKKKAPKVIPFTPAGAANQPAYRHRCTICGRTNISDPELEFRYCSRCTGYHCYCEDHISSHTHIQ